MSDAENPGKMGHLPMTRRDLVNGMMVTAGTIALAGPLASCSSASDSGAAGPKNIPGTLDSSWTGPGGVGDYAKANGNTHETVNAAHAVRDRALEIANPPAVSEKYDLIIVGGGISGLASAYYYLKERPDDRVLLVENNPIFGGEAKQNEIEVDGYRLHAPQGSNMCVWPATAAENLNFFWHKAWRELGIPMGNEPDAPTWIDAPNMPLPKNHYSAMMVVRERWPQAHFFPDPEKPGKLKKAMNPWENGYQDLPFSEEAKRELVMVDNYRVKKPDGYPDIETWLDTMTYKEFLTNVVGVTQQEVFDYLSPQIAAYGTGLGCESVSATAARDFLAPGTNTQEELDEVVNRRKHDATRFEPVSFPGGNGGIARYFVKKLIPEAIAGGYNLKDITYGKVNWDALDRSGQPLRIRCRSTAVDVHHEGPPETAETVSVTYIDNGTGEIRRVAGRRVIMCTGQWVNKYIVTDAPEDLREAMDQFNHAPMLILNVAVRNWKFIEKLGAPALRWYDGIGWFTNLRAPMSVDGEHMPMEPDKPAILTFYIPYWNFAKNIDFENTPVRAHCITSRQALFDMSFEEIETKIREQLSNTFSEYGFDHERDIAAIVANRWGHAYVVPEVGFFYGKDGTPAPKDIVSKGFGRIRFGHSEVSGIQLWPKACGEGERAAKQVLEIA